MTQAIRVIGVLATGAIVFSGVGMAQPAMTSPAAEERSIDNPPGRTGVSRTSNTGSDASGAATTPKDADRAPDQKLDSADEDFLENAAQSGHAEIEGSRMAQEKANSAEVREFAEQMIKDHSAVDEELKALAKAKGYTPPTEPSIVQKTELKALSMTDDGFDKMYASRIGVAAHESAVKLFREGVADTKDPDVKAFAEKTLPKLEHHLEMAKTLQQKVEGSQ